MTGWDLASQSGMLALTLFVMFLGLIFTFIPILPGTLIMWGAAIAYGWVLGWDKLGWIAFSLITLFMILGIAADAVAGHLGAKMGGASWWAIIVGAILGFILGLIASLIASPIAGCFAGMLGAIAGVLWVEWQRHKDWDIAMRATKGYVAGSAAGIMAKVTSGLLMLSIFLARVYWWP